MFEATNVFDSPRSLWFATLVTKRVGGSLVSWQNSKPGSL
uniref:Uncharacterized protein n=1 Tax=Anguilla anguilla TaxID=7936 RepID=A0A0E9URC5_ANGAN